MLHVFRHRDLRLTIAARAISAFGDNVALLVLMLRVYGHGVGPWSVTALLACASLPGVAMAPLAGRLVDRLPFRTLAIVTALWQAAGCVGLALVDPLWATYALVLLVQVGGVVGGPTWQALLPSLAEPDELPQAVGASQATTQLAAVVAPAAAGFAVGAFGYGLPLLVDAATFVVLAAAAVAVRTTRAPVVQETGDAESQQSFELRSDALLWPLMVGMCAVVLVGGTTNVVEVFLIRGSLGASPSVFGVVGALFTTSFVVGALLAGNRPALDPARARRAVLAALVLALGLVFAGIAPGIWVFAIAWIVVGVSNGGINADVGTLIYSRTPEAFRGRVLARVGAMVSSAEVGALAIGGAAGSLLGARATFLAGGLLMAAVAAALLARLAATRGVDAEVLAQGELTG
jgi:MFS family permease